LKSLHPNLVKAVAARHAAYQKRLKAEKRDAFCQQVRRTAADLLIVGQYPSRQKVQRLLPDSGMKGVHLIAREAKLAIAAFQKK
jgi:hypothetical protein